jgi:PAS domain S-box-containing protein
MSEIKVDFSGLPLSERESEILLLAADGLTDKEISERIGIAEGSVRTYWDRTRHKMSARSRSEAIAKALRQAYEAALRELGETQEWARIMVECSQDYAIFRTDPEGKLLTWNPGVAALLYYSQEEFVGKNISIIFTEQDLQAEADVQERRVADATGRSVDARWHVRRDGVKIWVEGTLVALMRNGKTIGYAKIMQDRTEEYQAKREVERLLRLNKLPETEPDPPMD